MKHQQQQRNQRQQQQQTNQRQQQQQTNQMRPKKKKNKSSEKSEESDVDNDLENENNNDPMMIDDMNNYDLQVNDDDTTGVSLYKANSYCPIHGNLNFFW